MSYPKVTETFLSLISLPIADIDQNALHDLEKFIVVYSNQCTLNSENSQNRTFKKGLNTIDNIPPTQAALLEHIKHKEGSKPSYSYKVYIDNALFLFPCRYINILL